MKFKLLMVWAVLILSMPLLVFSQSRQITGRITDAKGEAVPRASVTVKGTSTGTAADENGRFTISVTGNNPVLVISSVNFQTQEIRVGNSNNLAIELAGGTTLSEVTVTTALGIKRQKKELGYSTEEIKTAELIQSHQTNIVNALQGRTTGLQINSGGGAPGQGARIIMRGITSLDPSRPFQPLFVVDGLPIDNSTDVTTGDGRGMSNRAADINPDDIESVTILKGGAATALYGSRASTGAIIITTKSGKAGRFRLNYTSTYGTEDVNKYPEVQKTYTQGFGNIYDKTSFWPSWGPTVAAAIALDPTHPAELYNNYERGYQKGNFFRNTLNLSGGSEKATFGASFSQNKHDGVLPFSDFKSYSVKVNGDVKLSEKFRMGASANYINSGGNRKNADRYNEQLSYWAPRWDVMDYKKADGTMNVYGVDNDNPVFIAEGRNFIDDVNRIIGNVNFSYSPLTWLTFTYRAGADIIGDARTETAPGPTGKPGELYPSNDFGNYDKARGLGGFINEYRNNRRILNSTAILNIKRDITKNLNANLRLGHDIYDTRERFVFTAGDTLSDPTFFNLNNAKKVSGSNRRSQYRIIGAFGDLTLGWKDFLFLNLTGRNDWTSTLPEANRSFFYPSASISYILSQQFKLPDWISYTKLRASVAKIGKDAPPYAFSAGFIPVAPPIGGLTLSNRSGDPNLGPEFTTSIEGGGELRFLKNMLGIDFTYYSNTSKELIIPVSVTSSSGLTEVFLNAGSIRNKGIELSLTGTPVQTKYFTWTTRINYTSNDNKVLSISPGLTEVPIQFQSGYLSSGVTQKFIPGMPVGALFGRSFARYYGSDKEDAKFIDYNRPLLIGANGFPVVNTKQMYLGSSDPEWIGSFYNELHYKQFGLSFLFDTQQGIEKYNQLANWMAAFGIATYTTNRNDVITFGGLTSNGQPNTKPVFLGMGVGPDGVNYGNGYYRNVYRGISENFIENASFIKLRNVSLSYNLPSEFLTKTKVITGASISLTGNNLWLHTKYTGFDPESSSFSSGSIADGFAGFTYPATRSYMISLNLSF